MIAMLRRRLFQKKKKCKVVFRTGGGTTIQGNYPQGYNNYIEINGNQYTTPNIIEVEKGTRIKISGYTRYSGNNSTVPLYDCFVAVDGVCVKKKGYTYSVVTYDYIVNSNCTIAYVVVASPNVTITTQGKKLILSYDAQGGSGSFAAQEGFADSTGYATFVIPNYSPVKSGYTFIGWALTPSAATAEYGSGDSIKINKDTTLYAVYREQSQPQPDVYYTVTVSDGSEQGSTANCAPSIGGTGTYNVKVGSSITLYCYKSPNPDSDTAYIIVNGTNVITNTTRGSKMSYTYYVDKNCTISVYGHGLSTSTSVS